MNHSLKVVVICLWVFASAELLAQGGPSITRQPASQVVAAGDTVTLSVEATGAESYQWFKDTLPLAGANAVSCVITHAAASDAGVYRVRVARGASESVFSAAAVLMVGSTGSTRLADDFNTLAPGSVWSSGLASYFPSFGTEITTAGRVRFQNAYVPEGPVDRCLESSATLPLDRDWSVVVRLGLGSDSQFAGASGAGARRKAGFALGVVSSADVSDSFDVGFRIINSAGTLRRDVFSDIDFDGYRIPTASPMSEARESMLVRIDYVSATGTLVSSREEEGRFLPVSTADPLRVWGLTRSQTLRLGLRGFSTRVKVSSDAVWADDFLALVQPAGAPLSGQTAAASTVPAEAVTLLMPPLLVAVTDYVYQFNVLPPYVDLVVRGPPGDPPLGGSDASASPGYLSNLSVRAALAPGQQFIVGFVVEGGAKPVLVRGADLGPFIDSGIPADPRLALNGSTIADDWDASLLPLFAQLGAFPFAAGGKDAALLATLVGPQTAIITTASPGIVLAEIYDAGPNDTPRLTNLSTRFHVGAGDDVLIAGFVVSGAGLRQILVRAVGPTLAAQGVTGELADPQLHLFGGTNLLAYNDDWGGLPVLKTAFAATGASPLAADTSLDAALLVTLQPGVYTAQVSGVNGTTGDALVELYLVP